MNIIVRVFVWISKDRFQFYKSFSVFQEENSLPLPFVHNNPKMIFNIERVITFKTLLKGRLFVMDIYLFLFFIVSFIVCI